VAPKQIQVYASSLSTCSIHVLSANEKPTDIVKTTLVAVKGLRSTAPSCGHDAVTWLHEY